MIRALCALAFAVACALPARADLTYSILDFDDLKGWAADEHAAALSVFLNTCGGLRDPDWPALCNVARTQPDARTFFELFFVPVLIKDERPGLFTGYFEPEIPGSLTPTPIFRYPVYGLPAEIGSATPWFTRAEIETTDVMSGRGLELAWVSDPVDLFFLQIQGSGRILLPDGSHIRLGYGGANGHEYRSIGTELVRREIYEPHQVSARVIRNWVRQNPEEGAALLHHNPSYVFFRLIDDISPEAGPRGAMNRSITTKRTIAVDPAHVPLGAPVWIEKHGARPMKRLMIAQDTGSAIKGPQRADIFMGTGTRAGIEAGQIRDPGRLVVLMPIQRAYSGLAEVEG